MPKIVLVSDKVISRGTDFNSILKPILRNPEIASSIVRREQTFMNSASACQKIYPIKYLISDYSKK